ncbi:Splicing factor [Lecanora helva]
MDINSLLSPQETPRATPTPAPKPTSTAKKPRKPRASKMSQPSPLANTTLPSPSIPHSSPLQPQSAGPGPAIISPPSEHSVSIGSTLGTPPAEIAPRPTRQPSTAGMDTLADLASMQHHQQTARVNAGGLRSAEIYEHPATSSTTHPSLLTRPQASTHLREPSMLRGGTLDMAMADGRNHTPSPRNFSTAALSPEELETITQLANHLTANPFAYESHVELIKILHRGLMEIPHSERNTYNLLPDLQSAREIMNARFGLGEDLWVDWIHDQIMLARSLEDHITVMELCEKAVEEEPNSTKVWESYGQFMLFLYKSAFPEEERVAGIGTLAANLTWEVEDRIVAKEVFGWQQMIAVWERGFKETMYRLNDSHILWDTYTELLLHQLASSPSQDAIAQVQFHFVTRLQTPHAAWDNTLSAYSTFVSNYDNSNYENTMVAATRLGAEAKAKASAREDLELSVLRASQTNDKALELGAYSEYLEWELAQSRRKKIFDFELACALFQRATLRFSATPEIWEGYAMFLVEEASHGHDTSAYPILERATRHCPWSGTLWSQHLLAAENNNLHFTEVEDIKHKATSSGLLEAGGMEEVLKVQSAWCGFLRRRAINRESTDEDMDVAEVGIRSAIENMETLGKDKYGKEYQGDPQYRLEKIYIKYLSQGCQWESARAEFEKLVPRRGHSYEFWLRYYLWEMGTWGKIAYSENGHKQFSKPTEATKVLARAMKRPKVDWPEKIIETYQYHCEDNEDAKELQSSIVQVWKAKRSVQKRRALESYQAYDAAQAQAVHQQQPQNEIIMDDGENSKVNKRKREDDVEATTSKKVRPAENDDTDPQVEEQQPSAPSLIKRDRENATVVVKNLPAEITDTKVRQYFRDCGTINSLKLMPEDGGDSATASIEFDAKDDVLTAQTKDGKLFEGRAIEVKVGSGSTLYVCNFPPTADEVWVRKMFGKFGDIVDIRFPSLKFNTHRRFCYVQFKLSQDAQAATQLDGEDLGGDLRLLAKISDPGHKKDREGAIYEGREIYLANLDWQATPKDLKRAFSKYGTVEKTRIPKKVDGSSKGIGFVVFSTKDEAEAALEMNLTQFKSRVLNVMMSTNDKSKRQEARIITSTSQRSTASPGPQNHRIPTNGGSNNAASPTPPAAERSKYAEIQARTVALLNIPDTINEARIRALAEPYGELVKVSLRLDHQGVLVEYKDEGSAGKASLGLEGQEIAPGRQIGVGTVDDLKRQKGEHRSDRIVVGAAKKDATKLQGPTLVRRPNQPGARRGGKGGLGFKRSGVGLSGDRAMKDGEGGEAAVNGEDESLAEKGKAKSNADFKAMFLPKKEQ